MIIQRLKCLQVKIFNCKSFYLRIGNGLLNYKGRSDFYRQNLLLFQNYRGFSSNIETEVGVKDSSRMENPIPVLTDISPSPYPADSVAHRIFTKCTESFSPIHYIDIINESSGHSVPKGSETHFKIIIVSDKFQGILPLQRHRAVYNLLKPEMRNDAIPEDRTNYHKIHALSIISKTSQEWNQEKERLLELSSPKCQGGSKR